MRMATRAFLAGVLVLLITVTGRAAGVAVRGTVIDPADAPVPGATVELLAGARLVAKTVSGYQLASDNFVKGGINRVILATDGDFNVGVTSLAAASLDRQKAIASDGPRR